ncbi:MAG: M48 family metalloprotease [candidate division KSB1 bacterium]|nr:M48 family metalloprotease [candidate division KSB1 bacterium]
MNTKLFWRTLSVVSVVLMIVLFLYCAINPVTGQRELMLISESGEAALGKETDKQVVQQYGMYDDRELVEYISDIGQKMARSTHRPDLNYSFKILDSPVMNAFAVPGGYVYFTRGILAYFNNEAEMAGVLGHELGHISARHSAAKYSKQVLAQVGLNLGSMFSEEFAEWAPVAMMGVQMMFLKFSRDDERQADDLGVRYASRMGYDGTAIADFFRVLERTQPETQGVLPQWFSTHPNPEDRQETVRRQAREIQANSPSQTFVLNRKAYLQHINGIPFGNDPRQGYVQGNTFYHPDLSFTFPVPRNWNVINGNRQVQVTSDEKDAYILFGVSSERSPAAAQSAFMRQTDGLLVTSETVRVNNFDARKSLIDVPSQNDTLRVSSMYISKDNQVFVFHGITRRSLFSSYQSKFENSMVSFDRLTDPEKLDVKPQSIKIQQVNQTAKLSEVLTRWNVPADEQEKLALLNGMVLNDTVSSGELVKLLR